MINKKSIFNVIAAFVMPGILLFPTGCNTDRDAYKEEVYMEETNKDDSKDKKANKYIAGVDISTLIAEENSGVVYYDEMGNQKDIMEILEDSNINTVRIRVWNDPYDTEGNPYGGGNNDLQTALLIGKRATDNNLDVAIDFHYSDFWADPAKQMVPKAWENMTFEEKEQALYDYTVESLRTLIDAGVNVTMVQVGNETNGSMCGEDEWENITALMKSGAKAVRDISTEKDMDIKVILHFANPEKTDNMKKIAAKLNEYQVDYDIFGSSYYPYWHGTLDNLVEVLDYIADTYSKEILVAETSYAYTLEDGDGCGNSVAKGEKVLEYEVSVKGQSDFLMALSAALDKVSNSIGIIYWEAAWVPVPDNGNRELVWEKYGSGWASRFAAEYDPEDAGKYYGGNAWDNQTLFDENGKALSSLKTLGEIGRSHNR